MKTPLLARPREGKVQSVMPKGLESHFTEVGRCHRGLLV